MIGRILTRYAELSGLTRTVPVPTAYAMVDGIFERALLRHLSDVEGVLPELRTTAVTLGPRLFA